MVEVTILNSMAGKDFGQALDQHIAWGIEILDLKESIFGKNIVALTEAEAERAADIIRRKGLSVYCFSTGLFHGDIESGEKKFREDYLNKTYHVIELAKILQPDMIRLLAAQTSRRAEIGNSMEYIHSNHPWLIPLYDEAIHRLYDSGFDTTIENETNNCIFSNAAEIVDFFEELNCGEEASFTWDVQNLWQMGAYPSMDVYNKLKSWIGYYHLKGGQSEDGIPGSPLRWRSSLEDASWPVVEITRQVVMDDVSPVICLNSSHGRPKDGYDYNDITSRDLNFLRSEILEAE